MVDHNPRDCPNHILITRAIDDIEDMKIAIERSKETIDFLKGEQIRERERTEKIFELLGKMSSSIDKIQTTVESLSTKQDPFKEAMQNLALFFVKAALVGGLLVWASVNFGG